MKILLDTNILLWALANDQKKLKEKTINLILDKENDIFVSVISIWEIIIKTKLGKLSAPSNIYEAITQTGFKIMDLQVKHLSHLGLLPDHHFDPFDRMLICQTLEEKCFFITSDKHIMKYDISLFEN